ncbi:helix-turn-helix domain-containing protein [Actinomadura litoris]
MTITELADSTVAAPGRLADRVRAARLPPPDVRQRIRREAGIPLRTMAASLGVTAGAVQRWEQGRVTPRHEHAIAYRRLLDELEQAIRETP